MVEEKEENWCLGRTESCCTLLPAEGPREEEKEGAGVENRSRLGKTGEPPCWVFWELGKAAMEQMEKRDMSETCLRILLELPNKHEKLERDSL